MSKKLSATSPVKKVAAKKEIRSTQKAKAAFAGNLEKGYVQSNEGVLYPETINKSKIISANKLQAGIAAAQSQISRTLNELAKLFSQDLILSEVEMALSFNAEGKFIGFGVGSGISIKVKVKPSNAPH